MTRQEQITSALAEGGALHALTECKSFLVYELVYNPEHQKYDKKPRHPFQWGQRDQLLSAVEALAIIDAKPNPEFWGVGFAIHPDEPFFCVDLDNSFDPATDQWSADTLAVLGMLPGAAMELSTNGKGCHFFGRSAPWPHKEKPQGSRIEIYGFGSSRHFMALTGNMVPVPGCSADTDCSFGLLEVIQHFAPTGSDTAGSEAFDVDLALNQADPKWQGPTEDDDLLQLMLKERPKLVPHFDLNSPAPLSDKATFKQLFTGDAEVLGRLWPTQGEGEWDGSGADLALCNKLAFYTGKNPARMLRFWMASECWRPKLDSREDLWARAISKAISGCEKVMGEDKILPVINPPPEFLEDAQEQETETRAVELVEGYQFWPLDRVAAGFANCTYVRSMDKVFMANGEFYDQSQMNNRYGGIEFAIDRSQTVTKKPWDAFLQNKSLKFPQADRICFRPDLPPHELIKREGLIEVNTYIPVKTARQAGDASPFLRHLAILLPVERDQRILLTWMASLVQNVGVKFRWAPVLQGAEGNGKSMLLGILRKCIGSRYYHAAQASDIGNKFNDWIVGKLLIGVDELNASGEKKMDILSALLPMITERELGVQGKGKDAVTASVCANFFFTTNIRAALGQSVSSRRYALFYTAQQTPEDVIAAGLDGQFFTDYNKWLNSGGYGIINEFLSTYELDAEFNPAGNCVRAPHTSSFVEAVGESLGRVEQEVLNAIAEESIGFIEPWISGHYLQQLLEKHKLEGRVARNRRRELMQTLGYDWHPALKDGRTDNKVNPDGCKSILYVKKGHPINELKSRSEVARRYTDSQVTILGIEKSA